MKVIDKRTHHVLFNSLKAGDIFQLLDREDTDTYIKLSHSEAMDFTGNESFQFATTIPVVKLKCELHIVG